MRIEQKNLIFVTGFILAVAMGCAKDGNNSNVAAVPQACQSTPGSPACQPYNPQGGFNNPSTFCGGANNLGANGYGNNGYGVNNYNGYGYGNNGYGNNGYGNTGYGNSGYGNYGSQNSIYGYGAQQPCYPSGVNYGCSPGTQPVAWGGSFICSPVSSLTSIGGYPYYPQNWNGWGSGYSSGWGSLQGCNPNNGNIECGYTGTVCRPYSNGIGVCVFSHRSTAYGYYGFSFGSGY